jgi:N-acetylmuramic acid 6-phosphate etherase
MPAEELLSKLATEQVNEATRNIDRMTPLEIVQAMNAEDARVAEAVGREQDAIAAAITAIADRMRRGGRLIYAGAGTSGRLGLLDSVECPPTFNIPADRVVGCIAGGPIAIDMAAEDLEDSSDAGIADMAHLAVTANDVVVAITASGRTPYALGAIEYANGQGSLTIGVACNAGSPLAERVDIMIAPQVGPEVISGSTRLKAGTAQKMVLNMLSTGTMVLLGKTYGNLMVDVRATNQKLQQRAITIIRQATGADVATASSYLQQANGETKVAILMQLRSIKADEARRRLEEHDGNLRATLEAQL